MGNGVGGSKLGDAQARRVEVAEVEHTTWSAEFGEDIAQEANALCSLKAFAVNDGTESAAFGIPSTIGVPRRRVLNDHDRSVYFRPALPGKRLADWLAAQCFKRQAVRKKQGRLAQGVEPLFVTEDLERAFLDRNDGALAATVGEEALQLQQIIQGHIGSRADQEAQFRRPRDATQVGLIRWRLRTRQANPLRQHRQARFVPALAAF